MKIKKIKRKKKRKNNYIDINNKYIQNIISL